MMGSWSKQKQWYYLANKRVLASFGIWISHETHIWLNMANG